MTTACSPDFQQMVSPVGSYIHDVDMCGVDNPIDVQASTGLPDFTIFNISSNELPVAFIIPDLQVPATLGLQ